MENLPLIDLTDSEKMQLLQDSDWANDFNSIQLEALAKYFKSCSVASDIHILTEGEKNNLLCLLCEGKVDVIKENASGNAKVLQSLGERKIFGEISFFDRSLCSASIVTKQPSLLLVLTYDAFKKLCDESPNLALIITIHLIKSMSQKIRQTSGKLIDLL